MKHNFNCYQVGVALILAGLLMVSCSRRSSATPDYNAIRDAKDWQNPFIIVEGDGVEVVLFDDRARVTMDKLREYLSDLPNRYWPYGKIVAIGEGGIRAGNDGDFIRRNKAQTKQIVEAMGIRIKWWNVVDTLPPNKSLDRSGGSVFLIMTGPAMLE